MTAPERAASRRLPDAVRPGDRPRERLVAFLVDRLTEDLAALWGRDRPGLAAHVAVLDELLTTLRAGVLPSRRELRMLLFGYGTHPGYDPRWVRLLME